MPRATSRIDLALARARSFVPMRKSASRLPVPMLRMRKSASRLPVGFCVAYVPTSRMRLAMARPPLPPAEPMKLVPLAEIAKGGMGSVQLARAEGGRLHGHAMAIKRLHANIAQDPQFVGMFLDEAWMTAALQSPNVVRVAAWGEDEQGMF